MEISKTTVAIVAVACVTTGAAGGYVMTRSTASAGASARPTGQSLATDLERSKAMMADPRPAPARPAARARTTARSVTPTPVPAAPLAVPVEHPVVADPPEAGTDVVPIVPAPIEHARSSDVPLPQPLDLLPSEVEELVIAGDSVIGLQIETAVTSETARVEDAVVARVSRDVMVGNRVAIPAGSKAQGEVTLVERGGKVKDRARLGVRFTSIVLADGTRLPIDTEAIYREGDSPGRESTTKIGVSAIAGTIIGGLIGGGKGAAIGGAVGGGAGSATVLAGGRNPATLMLGSPVTVRLREPATVTVER